MVYHVGILIRGAFLTHALRVQVGQPARQALSAEWKVKLSE